MEAGRHIRSPGDAEKQETTVAWGDRKEARISFERPIDTLMIELVRVNGEEIGVRFLKKSGIPGKPPQRERPRPADAPR
jgi:hypothetical protein